MVSYLGDPEGRQEAYLRTSVCGIRAGRVCGGERIKRAEYKAVELYRLIELASHDALNGEYLRNSRANTGNWQVTSD